MSLPEADGNFTACIWITLQEKQLEPGVIATKDKCYTEHT